VIVKLDGPLHRAVYDANRDAEMHALGYRVLRFPNDEIGDDFAVVLSTILHHLRGGAPSPRPLPRWGRGNLTWGCASL
jgi:very-short-patch-repair endonuclease